MITRLSKNRFGPIGVDVGSRSVKLVQFTEDGSRLLESSRWDMTQTEETPDEESVIAQTADAIGQALEGRAFKGRDVVLCLNDRQLFLQNIRVPRADAATLDRSVQQEAAGRVPYPVADVEIRYL